jgi:hypothetical protein
MPLDKVAYEGAPFEFNVVRAGDQVVLHLIRDGESIVEVYMSKHGATSLAHRLMYWAQ